MSVAFQINRTAMVLKNVRNAKKLHAIIVKVIYKPAKTVLLVSFYYSLNVTINNLLPLIVIQIIFVKHVQSVVA